MPYERSVGRPPLLRFHFSPEATGQGQDAGGVQAVAVKQEGLDALRSLPPQTSCPLPV